MEWNVWLVVSVSLTSKQLRYTSMPMLLRQKYFPSFYVWHKMKIVVHKFNCPWLSLETVLVSFNIILSSLPHYPHHRHRHSLQLNSRISYVILPTSHQWCSIGRVYSATVQLQERNITHTNRTPRAPEPEPEPEMFHVGACRKNKKPHQSTCIFEEFNSLAGALLIKQYVRGIYTSFEFIIIISIILNGSSTAPHNTIGLDQFCHYAANNKMNEMMKWKNKKERPRCDCKNVGGEVVAVPL